MDDGARHGCVAIGGLVYAPRDRVGGLEAVGGMRAAAQDGTGADLPVPRGGPTHSPAWRVVELVGPAQAVAPFLPPPWESGAGCVTVEGADDEEAAGCCGGGMGAATFARGGPVTLPGAARPRAAAHIASASPSASASLRRWRRDQCWKNAGSSTSESTAFSSTARAAMISAVSEGPAIAPAGG